MADDPAFDVLAQASESLAGLALPLTAAAQAQQAAAAAQQAAASQPPPPPLPLSQAAYAYGPQTAQQAAQQQAQQQQYPAGGAPAWMHPPAPAPMQAAQQQLPPPTPQQQAQQQARQLPPFALPLSPGDLALERARATPMPPQQQPGGAADAFGAALRSTAASVLIMKAAVTQTADTLLSFGAKASPTHAATLTGSFDLLSARIGTFFLPAMEEMARAAQTVARNLPDASRPRGFLGGASLEDVARPGPLSLVGLINRFSDEPMAESWAGLPAARQSSHEEAYDRLQNAAANLDPLQAEQLKIVNENLKNILGVLQAGGNRGDRLEITFR